MNVATALIGPLMVPECTRSARRGWGLLIRSLGGVAMAIPALVAVWWWWMSQGLDNSYQPVAIVPLTLFVLETLALVIVLILCPAILAGSLAGERERGSIGLLLSTSVDAREIVMGRMFGLLSMVLAMLMAGLPFLLVFASLAGLDLPATACLLTVPLAVSFGIGGLSMAASAVARRGRNALIVIYLIEALILVVPALILELLARPGRTPLQAWLDPFSPFSAVGPLVMATSLVPAISVMVVWSLIGAIGITLASIRLRPSFLALVGGKKGNGRRHLVPPVDENRPMLWKELHIERIGALGWFGRLLGVLLMVYLIAGTVIVAGLAMWALYYRKDSELFDRYKNLLSSMYESPAFLVSILIQLAVGLRAAVTISSEREQGTWDALLASPLTGREILWGKLWGSLYSLRFVLGAILFAWGVSVALGAMDWQTLITCVGMTIVVSAFAAAVGVRASLSSATATRAMSVMVGSWLATGLALSALAGLALLVVVLTLLLTWLVARPLGLVSWNSRPWVPTYLFEESWFAMMALSYLVITGLVVMAARTRFDEIAGRLAGDGSDRPPAPRYLEDEANSKDRQEALADAL